MDYSSPRPTIHRHGGLTPLARTGVAGGAMVGAGAGVIMTSRPWSLPPSALFMRDPGKAWAGKSRDEEPGDTNRQCARQNDNGPSTR